MVLVPCTACARHVRENSSRCPFCDAPVEHANGAPVELPRGASRAAIIAMGATLALGACRSHGPGSNEPSMVVLYGAPPMPDAPAPVGWNLSATATYLPMSARAAWRLRIAATNNQALPVDPGRHGLSFTLNGQPSMAAELAFTNGAREHAWVELPPGQTVSDERALGTSLFAAPGTYWIVLLHEGREVARVVVRVVPDPAQIAR